MPRPKEEALAALGDLKRAIAGPDPISPRVRVTLVATLEYAIAQVEAIEELKRARKKAPAAPGGETC